MGWSTVEWPPKNGPNIKPKPKLRKQFRKTIIICLTVIILLIGLLVVGVLSDSNNLAVVKYINNYYLALCSKIDLLINNIKPIFM